MKKKKYHAINIEIEIWKTIHHEIFPEFTFVWKWIDSIEFRIWFDFKKWWKQIDS